MVLKLFKHILLFFLGVCNNDNVKILHTFPLGEKDPHYDLDNRGGETDAICISSKRVDLFDPKDGGSAERTLNRGNCNLGFYRRSCFSFQFPASINGYISIHSVLLLG